MPTSQKNSPEWERAAREPLLQKKTALPALRTSGAVPGAESVNDPHLSSPHDHHPQGPSQQRLPLHTGQQQEEDGRPPSIVVHPPSTPLSGLLSGGGPADDDDASRCAKCGNSPTICFYQGADGAACVVQRRHSASSIGSSSDGHEELTVEVVPPGEQGHEEHVPPPLKLIAASESDLFAGAGGRSSFLWSFDGGTGASNGKKLDRAILPKSTAGKTTTRIAGQLLDAGCSLLPTRARVRKWVGDHVPVTRWGPAYNVRECFVGDLLGGIIIGLILICQTMAHAAIATTVTVQGPYCALFPALVYALFGTSPHASISSGAVAAVLIAEQLEPFDDIVVRTKVASMYALLVGIILFFAGLFKLTFLVRFLSQPTLSGFITGAALIIAANQSKQLTGLDLTIPQAKGFFPIVFGTIAHCSFINWVAVAMGCGVGLLLWSSRKIKPILKKRVAAIVAGETFRAPGTRGVECGASSSHKSVKPSTNFGVEEVRGNRGGSADVQRKKEEELVAEKRRYFLYKSVLWVLEFKELLVVIFTGGLVYLSASGPGPTHRDGLLVSVVGPVPQGLPPFRLPWEMLPPSLSLQKMFPGAVLIAITSYLTTFASAKRVAMQQGYEIKASQEAVAVGLAGVTGGFFGSFPISGSLSRTALLPQVGVKTQLGGVISMLVVAGSLVFFSELIYWIPKCALSGIIILACTTLQDFKHLRVGIIILACTTLQDFKHLRVVRAGPCLTGGGNFDSVPTIFKVVRFLCGLGHGVGKVVAMRCLDRDTVDLILSEGISLSVFSLRRSLWYHFAGLATETNIMGKTSLIVSISRRMFFHGTLSL